MLKSEKILRIVICVLLGIIVFYSLKFIIPRIKLKENLTQYCDPIFTAHGTEVSINPLGVQKYVSVDKNSSKDNVILSSIASDKWELERIIDRKSMEDKGQEKGFYNDFSKPDRCSVYIKTKSEYMAKKDEAKYLYYYLTRNNKENFVPGIGKNHVSASLFGKETGQMWYVIDTASLSTNGAYGDIVSISKNMGSENDRYVFIVTDPTAFKDNKETSKTQFLTANIGDSTNKYSFNSLTIQAKPTEYSIWQLSLYKKGTVKPLPDYKPTLSVDEFPNKDNKSFATFMNTYLPIWNRTWYSNDKSGIKSFEVKLFSPGYKIENGQYSVKDTFATGTVTFDNKYDGSMNKAVYEVKSMGSDVLVGENEKDNSTLILHILPQSKIPSSGTTLPKGVPTLQAWVIKKSKNGKLETLSMCASSDKNFSGVCISTLKPDGFQQYLIKKDFAPINSETNFNISNNVENFQDWKNTVNYKSTRCPSVGNLLRCIQ